MTGASQPFPAWSVHLVGAMVFAASAAGWYAMVVYPSLTASAREASLRELRDALATEASELVQRCDDRIELLRTQERELNAAAVRLRPASALNSIVAGIARLAGAHKLALQEVVPGAGRETALAVRLPLRIAANGTSADGVRFLAALRESFPDVAVEGFEFARGEQSTSETKISFDLTWYADRAAERAAVAAPPT